MGKGDIETVALVIAITVVLVIGLAIMLAATIQDKDDVVDCVAVCEQETITEEPNNLGCDCDEYRS